MIDKDYKDADTMTNMVKICSLQDIPVGEMLSVESPDLPPLAAFNVDGEIFVTSNICTHNTALLTDGYFEGEVIECPLHGGCFNVRTGEAEAFPCELPLKTYPVVKHGDDLLIAVSDAQSSDGQMQEN